MAHEFLVKHWRPMYATHLRAELAPIAVVFAGCADLIDNHDAWSLRSDDRAFLAGVTNADLRRFVRDFLLPRAFRLDVFTRGARRIGEREQRRRLIASTFALTCPEKSASADALAKSSKKARIVLTDVEVVTVSSSARGRAPASAAGGVRLK